MTVYRMPRNPAFIAVFRLYCWMHHEPCIIEIARKISKGRSRAHLSSAAPFYQLAANLSFLQSQQNAEAAQAYQSHLNGLLQNASVAENYANLKNSWTGGIR